MVRRLAHTLVLAAHALELAVALVLALVLALVVAPSTTPVEAAGAGACATGTSSAALTQFLQGGSSGLLGGDDAHTYSLPGGRTLWLFQDVFMGPPTTPTLWAGSFVHNAGLIQTGVCFELVHGGSDAKPVSYLGGDMETPLAHWFWPLGGGMGADGQLHVFAAEYVNDNRDGAAPGATPVATWVATINPDDLTVTSFTPAPDPAAIPLYGFSVVDTASWTYLYGNCFRQFTTPGILGDFDVACNTQVSVARVPKGHYEATPTYWDGSGWSTDRNSAATIHQAGALADPLQVQALPDGRYLGIAKVDDWWGTSVSAMIAATPVGPFTTYARRRVPTMCGTDCNTYFAAPLPWREANGSIEVSLSSNTWDLSLANATPQYYRPSVITMPAPAANQRRIHVGAPDTMAVAQLTTDNYVSGAGWTAAYDCDAGFTGTSSINNTGNPVASNLVIVPTDDDGDICVASLRRTDVVVDVAGTLPDADIHSPNRVFDSRIGGARATHFVVDVGAPNANVVVQLTTDNYSTGTGWTAAYDCDAGFHGTSSVNNNGSPIASNLAIVPSDAHGQICVDALHPTDLVVDVTGTLPSGAIHSPTRVLDTRNGQLPVATDFRVHTGDPGATVALQLTTDNYVGGTGWTAVFACDTGFDGTSSVNNAGHPIASNLAIVRTDQHGDVCVRSMHPTDLIVDVAGTLPTAAVGTPVRIFDSRD